jgi:alpha-mannosidase
MLKFLSVLIFVFCFMFSGFAQESLITYSRPFSYEKVNGKLVTDAKIYYEGSKKNLTIELGDKRLAYQVEGDSLLVKLPLIGDKSSMVFKEKGHLIKSQEFSPYISADWNYFGNGTIDIINTSHQDIAWMSTPDSCKDERIHKIIIPALEMSEKNPGFGFGMEQTLNLREILDEYPNYKPVIKEAYQKKIFSWGATLISLMKVCYQMNNWSGNYTLEGNGFIINLMARWIRIRHLIWTYPDGQSSFRRY